MIAGASMAPTLRGIHFRSTCTRCQYTFCFDAEQVPADGKIVCPNCGGSQIDLTPLPVLPADRVRIEPIQQPISRWQTIAVCQTDERGQEQKNVVKRVVGLPGESLAISQGDVFADGRRIVKPLDIQRRTRVFVFDSDYRPPPDGESEPRFRFRSRATGATDSLDSGGREKVDDDPAGFDLTMGRLIYRHAQNFRRTTGSEFERGIVDFYPYNQNTSRTLHLTDQLYYSADLCLTGPVTLSIQLWHHRHPSLEIRLIEQGEVAVALPGQDVRRFPFSWRVADRVGLEISTFDEQLVVVVEGQVVAQTSLEQPIREVTGPSDLPVGSVAGAPGNRPRTLAFQAVGARCHLQRLRLWRDLYYYDVPPDRFSDRDHPFRIADGHYVLMGDNVPRSRDSRVWVEPTIGEESILGVVERLDPVRESETR